MLGGLTALVAALNRLAEAMERAAPSKAPWTPTAPTEEDILYTDDTKEAVRERILETHWKDSGRTDPWEELPKHVQERLDEVLRPESGGEDA